MNDDDIPGQELIDALQEQRNMAMNDAALAKARLMRLQNEFAEFKKAAAGEIKE